MSGLCSFSIIICTNRFSQNTRNYVVGAIGIRCFQATFDTSKHLTDKNIKRRRLERERIQLLQEKREMKVRVEREEEEKRREEER